jgi:hypothetical protein
MGTCSLDGATSQTCPLDGAANQLVINEADFIICQYRFYLPYADFICQLQILSATCRFYMLIGL